MSPVSPLKQIWPEAAEMTPEQMALAALRQEIDALDDALLDLFQQRLALASRVGLAKDAPAGPHTKLRPDREQAVLARMLARAAPDTAEAVEALWREIVGWGLNRQGRLQVQVWAPTRRRRGTERACVSAAPLSCDSFTIRKRRCASPRRATGWRCSA